MDRNLLAPFVLFTAAVVAASATAQLVGDGDEFRVNTMTQGDQVAADVVARGDGSFVVVWGGVEGVLGQRFTGDGRPLGSEIVVHSRMDDPADDPRVAASGAGALVVVWSEGDYPRGYVRAQRLDSGGQRRGDAIVLSEFGEGGREPDVDVAMSHGGDFVVTWGDYLGQIYLERFGPAGDRLDDGPQLVQESEGGEVGNGPAIAVAADGAFVVVWSMQTDFRATPEILGQRFSRAGDREGERFEVSSDSSDAQTSPDVAMAPEGSFVVVWQVERGDASGLDVLGQRFDAAGTRVGAAFEVNTHTANGQLDPSVAMRGTGDFFVAWTSRDQDGSEEGVFGQLFGRAGARIGSEIAVNVASEGAQERPAIAMSLGGAVLAVWDGPSADGGAADIFGRLLASGSSGHDRDDDGVGDDLDNCPTVANADQLDAQADGYGDECVSPDVFIPPSAQLGANPVIGRGTTIQAGVAVGDDATIGEYVRLERQASAGDRLRADDFVSIGPFSSLGNNVVLGFATRVGASTAIGDGVTIADQVVVRRSVTIDDGARIDPLVVVYAGARIGAGATIGMGARIGRGAVVDPGAVVPPGTSVSPGGLFPR